MTYPKETKLVRQNANMAYCGIGSERKNSLCANVLLTKKKIKNKWW